MLKNVGLPLSLSTRREMPGCIFSINLCTKHQQHNDDELEDLKVWNCNAVPLLLHMEKKIDKVLLSIEQDVQVCDATGARQNSCSLLRNNKLLNDLAHNLFAKGHGPI